MLRVTLSLLIKGEDKALKTARAIGSLAMTYIKTALLEKKEIDLVEKLKRKYRIYDHSSMQHLTYENIYKMKKEFDIDFESSKLKVIASVRNPYDRILSDMFYNALITPQTTPEGVFQAMKTYLSKDCYDAHNHPQHTFVTKNGNLVEGIVIMKQDNLTEEMKKNGYTDFNTWSNRTFTGMKVNYRNYLNEDSIKLINNVFQKDFELFGYEMIPTL